MVGRLAWLKASVGWQGRRAQATTWLLALLLSLPVAVPTLLNPIEDRATDITAFHLYRSILFSDALDQGWLYPRWADALNGGLGSPAFTYYSPGPYYVIDLFRRLGLSHVLAWRVLLAGAAIAACLGACALVLALCRRPAWALLGAASYLYAPALLRDLWQRGSPQGLATALLPWTLLALQRLADRPGGRRVALGAAAVAALILCHSVSATLLCPVLLLFSLYLALAHERRAAASLAGAACLSVLLSAIYLGPALLERGNVQLERLSWEGADPASAHTTWSDLGLWAPTMDAGTPNANALNYRQVDLWQLALLTAGAAGLAIAWRALGAPLRLLCAGALLLGLVGIAVQFDWAATLWAAPTLRVFQFRWRALSLVAPGLLLTLAALGGTPPARGRTLPLALAGCVLALSLPRLYPGLVPVLEHVQGNATPQEITQLALASGAYDLSTGEFQPVWRQWSYSEEEMYWTGLTPIANLPEGARWLTDERTARSRVARFVTPVAFEASLHLLYFPGWQVSLDGTPIEPYPSDGGGYLTVSVPAGEHEIVAYYAGTAVQHGSTAISGTALVACLVLAVIPARRRTEPMREAPEGLALPWWLVALLALAVAAKLLWIDPHTGWLRYASTREAIAGATSLVEANYDGAIQLHGYRLQQTTVAPGRALTITLYWSADGFADRQYPVCYVHVLGTQMNPASGDYLWGQSDTALRPGNWAPGLLYSDTHTLVLDPAAPEGAYALEIGWWWPETGQQMHGTIMHGPLDGSLQAIEAGYLLLGGVQVQR